MASPPTPGGNGRSKWNDSRLDDLALEVRALRNLPAEMAKLQVSVESVKEDAHTCVGDLGTLKDTLAHDKETQAKERKTDRNTLIATILTSAGLLLAAINLLGDKT